MQAQGGTILSRTYFWIAAIVTAAADLISKDVAFRYVVPEEDPTRPIIDGILWCSRHINYGGVWGALHGYNIVLLGFTALVIPAVVLMAYTCRVPRAPLWALGLLLGGAVGNLVDRVIFSGVRDFIDLGWWPVFNVADIALVIGVFVYMGWSLFYEPSIEAETPPSDAAPSETKDSA